ncbi:hypothetical protein BH23GEM9_BH23GEM9_14100 [soil metagenome]
MGIAARATLLCGLTPLFTTAAAAQQGTLREQCVAAASAQVRAFCENVADAATIIQPRIGIAASGGNPVPGTASTMGMRLGSMPRVGLGLRVSAANVELPPIERVGQARAISFPVGTIAADATVGLYRGIALLPTVGGFASIDLLGSVGVLPLPRGEGFDDSAAMTWAVGARLGVLRESFTAPGVSVDVMYRSLGDVAYGSADLSDRDAFLGVSDYRVASVRGVVGKRVLGFGATAGAAYDHYTADVAGRVLQPEGTLEVRQADLSTRRVSLFANASLTILILNMAAEMGWQRGGTARPGASTLIENGGLFGGIAVRLAI